MHRLVLAAERNVGQRHPASPFRPQPRTAPCGEDTQSRAAQMLDLARPGGEPRADRAAEKSERRRNHHRERPALDTEVSVENIAKRATAVTANVRSPTCRWPADRKSTRLNSSH